MKRLVVISTLFFGYFSYGLFLSQYDVRIIEPQLNPRNPDIFYDYKGAIHVHTSEGEGSGSYEEVIAAAQAATLDFVYITDVNHLEPDLKYEGYFGKTLSLIGHQFSYLDSRLLYYSQGSTERFSSLAQAQVHLTDVLSQTQEEGSTSLLVLAHPLKEGYEWSGPYPPGLDGLEVINLKSVWRESWEKSKISFVWSILIYGFNPDLALLRIYREPTNELRLWDELTQKQTIYGFLGNHATAQTSPLLGKNIRFPSYERSFEVASTHLLLNSELTGDFQRDRQKIQGALASGQFYMSIDLLGNPKGFSASVRSGNKTYPIGSHVPYSKNMNISVELPQKPKVPFDVHIIQDGKRIYTSNARKLDLPIHSPGVYRVLVRVIPTLPLPDGKQWKTWILTNPIFVEKP